MCFLFFLIMAVSVMEVLNFIFLNNKSIRMMFFYRDFIIRKSGVVNMFMKVFVLSCFVFLVLFDSIDWKFVVLWIGVLFFFIVVWCVFFLLYYFFVLIILF